MNSHTSFFKFLWIAFFCFISTFGFSGVLPEGYYTIKLASSGKNLDIDGGNIETNSTKFHLWSRVNKASQTFKIEELSHNVFLIRSAGSHKAMDASYNQRNQNGCPIIVWDKNEGQTQAWEIKRISGNKFSIQLKSNGKALSASIADFSQNGGKIQLWEKMERYKNLQEWIIEPLKEVVNSPKYVDLRANQTPYKHQALNVTDRGSCTYFASLAALEASYKKKNRRNLDLSEEAWSIYAKMLEFNTDWSAINHADQRENQFSRTQGGGFIKLLATGIRIPEERVAPYQKSLGTINWRDQSQKNCNTHNFSVLTDAIQNAPLTYGVKSYKRLSNLTAGNIQNVLRQGHEIMMGINNGGHVLLLVGYDITDPNDKKFIVKNSYVRPKSNGQFYQSWEWLEYLSYDEIPEMRHGDYITEVLAPAPWTASKIFGQWHLNYDGWKGRLDIYHLPGLMNDYFDDPQAVQKNGRVLKDLRIGTFYNKDGKAHRVNGYLHKSGVSYKLIFYIDGKNPNLRWDQLSGDQFEYYLNGKMDFMAGSHKAPDGRRYGGFASKSGSYQVGRINLSNAGLSAFNNTRYMIRLGHLKGQLRFGNATSTYIQGELTDDRGYKSYVRIRKDRNVSNGFQLTRYSDANCTNQTSVGTVRFHSWEHGIMSGKSKVGNSWSPLLLVKQ